MTENTKNKDNTEYISAKKRKDSLLLLKKETQNRIEKTRLTKITAPDVIPSNKRII